MRRLLLLCLLVMLPFQVVWSAVAGIAALDVPCAASQHVALQEAQHAAPQVAHGAAGEVTADMPGALDDCHAGAPAEPCCDGGCGNCSNCGSCHGHAPVAIVGAPAVLGGTCSGGGVRAGCSSGAPDHVPEHPLRPPLLHLA